MIEAGVFRFGKWLRLGMRTLACLVIGAFVSLPTFAKDGTTPNQAISSSDPFAAYQARLNDAASRTLEGLKAAPPVPATTRVPAASTKAEEAAEQPVLLPWQSRWQRVERLRPIIEPILHQEGVPVELTAIVLVESGGQPEALSPKGARGIWQFMPETARRYGLIVNPERDERLDIQRSTHAAARYLRDLYRQFGDWRLVFAAYNAGEDVIQHAIDRDGTRDFSRLSSGHLIPLETRQYVPAVVDAEKIFSMPGNAVVSVHNVARSRRVYADAGLNNETRKESGP